MRMEHLKNVLLIGAISLSLAFCSSNDKKDTPPEKKDETKEAKAETKPEVKETPSARDTDASFGKRAMDEANNKLMESVNEKLKDVRYPDGVAVEGFAYKKWEIPNKQDFVKWVKVSGSIIKEALDKLPANYQVELTGHADAKGPEEPTGDKKGNIFYSEQRAKEIKSALVKLGFPEQRIATKGAGSSIPVPGVDPESGKNRRVTFQVIATDAPAEAPTDKPADSTDQTK